MLILLIKLLTATTTLVRSGVIASPTVTLPSGVKVTGLAETSYEGTPIHSFLGIPYTDAPVGENRWKQSKLKTLTSDVNATAYGSICYGDPSLDAVSGQFPPSEDCLYLNVFTPAGVTPSSKLPVMVWVHGGGFIAGAGNPYPGNNLIGASGQKVIVVNFNYRLGSLGFLSNEEILKEGDGANFGLRDQEVAFAWVKKYIAYFGGNPDDITAFGESAGAWSLAVHLISRDGNQQMFKRAILQSGGYTSVQSIASRAVQASQTTTIGEAVGCSGAELEVLACLRKADAGAVFAAGKSLVWGPTIDREFLYEAPYLRLASGQVSRVPTIIGSNTDDGWYLSFGAPEASQFESWVRNTFPLMNEDERTRLNELYPLSAFSSAQHRCAEAAGDYTFICPGELISAIESRTVPNTYRYRFNFPGTALGQPLVLHAEDLNFVFDRQYNLKNDSASRAVVRHFQDFWTNFAISGSPNGDDPTRFSSEELTWPKYDETSKRQIILQPKLDSEADTAYMPHHAERCAFWNAVEARLAPDFD